jgi:hypothetical protein
MCVFPQPARALAGTPASLNGEGFTGQENTRTLAGSCPSTNNGSFAFSTSGTATGPYPGTFHEAGTFTISTDNNAGVPAVTAFSATFTIISSAGNVTGTKALAHDYVSPQFEASCDFYEAPSLSIPAYWQAPPAMILSYTATIDNNYQEGSASLWLFGDIDVSPGLLSVFSADFSSAPAGDQPQGDAPEGAVRDQTAPEGTAPTRVGVEPAITPGPRPTRTR